MGYEITYLPVNEFGQIDLNDLKHALREDTILVSVMHVNNEVGSIQPIAEMGKLLKQYPHVLFHVDNVQGQAKFLYQYVMQMWIYVQFPDTRCTA